jgi:hypothetical protein
MITTISTVDNTSRPHPISHRFGSVAVSMINTMSSSVGAMKTPFDKKAAIIAMPAGFCYGS